MSYEDKLTELKIKIDKAKNLKIRAEARMEQLQKQKEEIEGELNSLGVTPENLDSEITRLKEDIELMISKIEDLLPEDVLQGK